MTRTIQGLIFTAGLLSFSQVSANNNTQMETMVKHTTSQFALQKQAMLEVMNNPEMLKANAIYTRNFYLALIDAGFTKTEAMEIVVASVAN